MNDVLTRKISSDRDHGTSREAPLEPFHDGLVTLAPVDKCAEIAFLHQLA